MEGTTLIKGWNFTPLLKETERERKERKRERERERGRRAREIERPRNPRTTPTKATINISSAKLGVVRISPFS